MAPDPRPVSDGDRQVSYPAGMMPGMSMIGMYARLTPAEMARALDDPESGRKRIDEMTARDDADGHRAESARVLDIYKSWHLLSYLFDRAGAAPDPVLGGRLFAPDDDWGYGPPSYFAPDEVARVAAYLRATPYERLAAHYDAADLNARAIYPERWEADGAGWAESWYEGLIALFSEAAWDGDAIVFWLT
jgi:hypothetical protein